MCLQHLLDFFLPFSLPLSAVRRKKYAVTLLPAAIYLTNKFFDRKKYPASQGSRLLKLKRQPNKGNYPIDSDLYHNGNRDKFWGR